MKILHGNSVVCWDNYALRTSDDSGSVIFLTMNKHMKQGEQPCELASPSPALTSDFPSLLLGRSGHLTDSY